MISLSKCQILRVGNVFLFVGRSKLIDENAHKENLKRILEMKRNLKSKKDLM